MEKNIHQNFVEKAFLMYVIWVDVIFKEFVVNTKKSYKQKLRGIFIFEIKY